MAAKEPSLSKQTIEQIELDSIKIFKLLKLKHYARIDWMLRDNKAYFLEATPLPAFDKEDCFDWCAKQSGTKFYKILFEIIDYAWKN